MGAPPGAVFLLGEGGSRMGLLPGGKGGGKRAEVGPGGGSSCAPLPGLLPAACELRSGFFYQQKIQNSRSVSLQVEVHHCNHEGQLSASGRVQPDKI